MPNPIDMDTKRPSEEERPSRRTSTPKSTPKPRPKIGERDEEGNKVRSPSDRKLITEVAGLYQGAGLAISGIGAARSDQGVMGTGAMMVNNAESAADAWMDLADRNPKVKAALSGLTEASAIGSLVMVHLAMLMPLLADRNIIPAEAAAVAGAMMNTNGNANAD